MNHNIAHILRIMPTLDADNGAQKIITAFARIWAFAAVCAKTATAHASQIKSGPVFQRIRP
jgi:hypothetical protein